MGRDEQERGVASRLASAIRAKWGKTGRPSDAASQAIRVSKRTVDAWLEERQAPRAAQLIALMRESEEVFQVVCELAGREPPPNLSPAEREAIARALDKLTGVAGAESTAD